VIPYRDILYFLLRYSTLLLALATVGWLEWCVLASGGIRRIYFSKSVSLDFIIISHKIHQNSCSAVVRLLVHILE